MSTMTEVAGRIRRLMPVGMSQRQLARRVDMTPDALSRALSGQRGLSPLEVAKIAKTLGADTHWLITGAADPFTVSVAARHSWDARRRVRVNEGHADDQQILDQVVALYRAAYPQGPDASAELSTDAMVVRDLLGQGFIRAFAESVERQLSVDVIRIPGLTTDYSIRIGVRGVVVLATQSSWFRSNWSLAHELGHLALGHHSSYDSPRRVQRDEKQADGFAGSLLVPTELLGGLAALEDEASVARAVWDLGVSTEALRNHLRAVKLTPPVAVTAALAKATPRLLRDNLAVIEDDEGDGDPVVGREQAAAMRSFPLALLSALQSQIDLGAASPVLLAWALDVPVDDIDFPEPSEAVSFYEEMLHDRPDTADWRGLIHGATSAHD